jgi:hypothetical protein
MSFADMFNSSSPTMPQTNHAHITHSARCPPIAMTRQRGRTRRPFGKIFDLAVANLDLAVADFDQLLPILT